MEYEENDEIIKHTCGLSSRDLTDVCGDPATKKVRDNLNNITFWACDFHYWEAMGHPHFDSGEVPAGELCLSCYEPATTAVVVQGPIGRGRLAWVCAEHRRKYLAGDVL